MIKVLTRIGNQIRTQILDTLQKKKLKLKFHNHKLDSTQITVDINFKHTYLNQTYQKYKFVYIESSSNNFS